LCLFVGITLSLSEDQRFAWIGGKDTAMCPSEFFLRMTGDKRKSGWTDMDVHNYLRILESRSLIKTFTFKRIRSFQTFLGQYYFPLGRIFTHSRRGTSYVIQSYSLPKTEISNYRAVLFEKRVHLLKEGCSENRIMGLLEAYSYNTEEEGWWNYYNNYLFFCDMT
jgi:hypothetical protein